jgi:hypothetical protein
MAITTDEDVTRRGLLATLGAVGIAVLGAGFERPVGGATSTTSPPAPPSSPPFDVTFSITPWPDAESDVDADVGTTEPVVPPTSTTPTGRRTSSDDGGADDGGADDGGADDGGADDGGANDGETGTDGGSSTPATPSTGESEVVVEDGVRLANVLPGDGGVLTATLVVTGTPVSVDLYADAFDFTEHGVVEPERPRDTTPDAGELQHFLDVTLWYDRDGDGALGADEPVFYEGPLAGLRTLRTGVSFGACLPPGEHRLGLRWRLPADAGNVTQTDGATVSLTCAARACVDSGGE